MNCEQAKQLLKALETGDLFGEEARAVRMHFTSCPDCTAGLTPSQWIEILPAMESEVEPSEDFTLRFQSKLQTRPVSWLQRITEWSRPRRFVTAGAMAIVVLAGFFVLRYPRSKEDGAVYDSAAVAENLPLLKDMAVINDLDLLEDFDTIEELPTLINESATN
jgi:hypothetical protein